MTLASISFRCFVAIVLAFPEASVSAQTAGARVPLAASEIAEALRASGIELAGEQIELPLSVTTATPNAKLRLSSPTVVSNGTLRVRVTCEQSSECLPFFVTLHRLEDPAAVSTKLQPTVVHGLAASAKAGALLQAGQHATLLMENSHMRITLPVIAIDSGRPGTDIRVSTLDRKQTFHGVVTDAQIVRGNLE